MSEDINLTPVQIRAGQLAVEAITATMAGAQSGDLSALDPIETEVLANGLMLSCFIEALLGFASGAMMTLSAEMEQDPMDLIAILGLGYAEMFE